MRNAVSFHLALAALGALAAGCGAPDVGATGSAVARINVVPTGVQCLRVTAQPAAGAAFTIDRAVMEYTGAGVLLGVLPEGPLTVRGYAFTVPCAAAGTAQPAWVSDPASVEIRAGFSATVSLTMRPSVPAVADVDFVQPVRSIAAGTNVSFAILQDGSVRGWGSNFFGQLGDNTTTSRTRPVMANWVSGARQVSTGGGHTCAVLVDDTVKCWGNNADGQLGDGTTTSRPVAALVAGGARYASVAAGTSHTCAVTANDLSPTVHCWGSNVAGQLGVGMGAPSSPAPAPVVAPFIEVSAAASTTCGLHRNLQPFCWGGNAAGQFGADAPASSPTPLAIAGWPAALASLRVGGSLACALTHAGTVFCAGSNAYGQLGDGTTADRAGPVQVAGVAGAVELGVGADFACARLGDGTVRCWGRNHEGQIGVAALYRMDQPAAQAVAGLADVTQIAVGSTHACALRRDGTVWCWGSNLNGALGDGTVANRPAPVRVRF